MIVSDLDHIEVISETKSVLGGFCLTDYMTGFLPTFSSDSSDNTATKLSAKGGNVTAASGSFSTRSSSEGGDSVRVSIFTQGGGQAASFAQSGDLVTSLFS
jgi:hypothetical protein